MGVKGSEFIRKIKRLGAMRGVAVYVIPAKAGIQQ